MYMKFSRFTSIMIGLILIGLSVSVSYDAQISEAAFGTSPPWVRNDHLLPGTTFEQIVNLSRNTAGMDMQVNIRVEGDKEVLKWMKIENEKKLIMAKGVKILPMKVIIKVPRRAALKNYRAGIFVTLESIKDENAQQGGNVAIKLGAHILVELSVIGDKVVDYRVKSVSLDALNEGDIFHVNTEVENMGNTEITDLNGQIDIYDKKETEILKSFTFGTLEDSVLPDEIIRTKINISEAELEPGEYWVIVKVFKDNEVIYENRLYQKVKANPVPVITADDVKGIKRPSIPKLVDTKDEKDGVENFAKPPEQIMTILSEEDMLALKAAAGVQEQGNKVFLIFGIIGLVFGVMTMAIIVVLLIVLIKNQRRAAIQRYLTDQQKLSNE